MAPTNTAAWCMAAGATKLEISSAPYTMPDQKQIVIRTHAVAMNPVDYIIQAIGTMTFSWLKFPVILGSDIAGEVVEVGSEVTRFNVGDRVTGLALGGDKRSNKTAEGAFQHYVVLRDNLVSPIPDSMSYENASVIPLGLSTAACGLYMKDFLALRHPTNPATKPSGETLLIWGGSTSVGSNAIQLAVASGYEVFTTSSPRNFKYVKSLGASKAFDYNSPTVVNDIVAALKDKTSVGAFAIGSGSALKCLEIVNKCNVKKFFVMASQPYQPSSFPKGVLGTASMLFKFVSAQIYFSIRSMMTGVKNNFIFGSDLMENEVGSAIWVDFLPKALADGNYICAPEPEVIGKGLESIQDALNILAKGVSAKKIVVSV